MPRPDVETPSRVVDESKGLYKAEPQPKAVPPPDATPIPKFEKNKPPKYVTRPSKVLENPAPPPPNAVPYGGGGTPTVPYSSFAMGAGTATQAGMGFEGPGAGNFGARFSWYVEAVQRKISSTWLQSTVDPRVQFAPRVVATFDILRDGSGHEYSGDQIERKCFGGFIGGARHPRRQPDAAIASGVFGIEGKRGILV